MAVQVERKPLPKEFYQASPWFGSLSKFYVDDKRMLSHAVLDEPFRHLTRSIQFIIHLYGNFPGKIYRLLKQTVDPLFEPGEYQRSVFTPIHADALKNGDKELLAFARALYLIRQFFEQDKKFLAEYYHTQVAAVAASSHDEKLQQFSDVLRLVAKVHVGQVMRMLTEFIEK